jgi:hypothetical protein
MRVKKTEVLGCGVELPAPYIPYLGTRWRRMVSFTRRPPYIRCKPPVPTGQNSGYDPEAMFLQLLVACVSPVISGSVTM